MSKKIIGFFVCLVLVLTTFPVTDSSVVSINNQKNRFTSIHNDLLDGGWLEEHNGIKIVHLKGSFYEMGYQLGYFLKFEILRNIRAFLDTIINDDITIEDLWNIQKKFIPKEIVDYINGTAKAIGLSFDDVGCIWIWERTFLWHCSSMTALGPATKSNEVIHAYSLDFNVRPIDPITGKCAFEDPLLIVAKPDDGYAFMYPTFAGYVVESGVNEKGISISNVGAKCRDENDYGAPVGIRVFETLFHASSSEEAIEIINQNTTYGYNFMICDATNNESYIIEQTANHTYVGTWNDDSESIRPFYQLDYILRRSLYFLNPETATTQRDHYSPLYLPNILKLRWEGISNWGYYQAMSKGCKKYMGDLDLNNFLSVFRNMYMGRHGGVFWYLLKKTILRDFFPFYQWAICPKTGDMLICYSSKNKIAPENPIHYFNLFELLETEPSP